MIHTDIFAAFSPYLIAFLVAYLVTEGAKIVVTTIKYREFRWREFFKSGGMPSSHSAEVTALAVTVGMLNGFGSTVFAISAGLAAIVVYDAAHVRRATGEQGEAIKKIIERDAKLEREISRALGGKATGELRKPYFSRGHKPAEVLVGSFLGIIIGIVVACLSAS